MFDVLVIGAGPAGAAIAAALSKHGLRVAGLAPADVTLAWPNTYGIWADELEPLGLGHVLGPRWSNTVAYMGQAPIALKRNYALFDNSRLQAFLLAEAERGGVQWLRGAAAHVEHSARGSQLSTREGAQYSARLLIDASGHQPVLLKRPLSTQVAYQAAYGIVGRFSRPPVEAGQLVLMDYRADYLPAEERSQPPTFLYAMDLGQQRYFVEETSLAHVPGIPYETLKQRLYRRLAWMGTQVQEIEHIEFCLFPMNMPLPYFDQPLLGFGGAASMVHPASGYQVGSALKRAPLLAAALAQALDAPDATPARVARAGWRALWPAERVRRRHLYLFGLACMISFDQAQLRAFFQSFFDLPYAQWSGYLSDTHSTPQLIATMLQLFAQTSYAVRKKLLQAVGSEYTSLWGAARASTPRMPVQVR